MKCKNRLEMLFSRFTEGHYEENDLDELSCINKIYIGKAKVYPTKYGTQVIDCVDTNILEFIEWSENGFSCFSVWDYDQIYSFTVNKAEAQKCFKDVYNKFALLYHLEECKV